MQICIPDNSHKNIEEVYFLSQIGYYLKTLYIKEIKSKILTILHEKHVYVGIWLILNTAYIDTISYSIE